MENKEILSKSIKGISGTLLNLGSRVSEAANTLAKGADETITAAVNGGQKIVSTTVKEGYSQGKTFYKNVKKLKHKKEDENE